MEMFSGVTFRQIEMMKHAIGFEKNQVTGTKNRIMHAYRNRYYDAISNENLQWLCKCKLMKQGTPNEQERCTYWVTEEGFAFLARLCGFKKIVEVE
jgi:hypothetical protein